MLPLILCIKAVIYIHIFLWFLFLFFFYFYFFVGKSGLGCGGEKVGEGSICNLLQRLSLARMKKHFFTVQHAFNLSSNQQAKKKMTGLETDTSKSFLTWWQSYHTHLNPCWVLYAKYLWPKIMEKSTYVVMDKMVYKWLYNYSNFRKFLRTMFPVILGISTNWIQLFIFDIRETSLWKS